jgi:hypothetical protein
MRAVTLTLAACAFATYFAGIMALSAVATSMVHSAIYARPAPPSPSVRDSNS